MWGKQGSVSKPEQGEPNHNATDNNKTKTIAREKDSISSDIIMLRFSLRSPLKIDKKARVTEDAMSKSEKATRQDRRSNVRGRMTINSSSRRCRDDQSVTSNIWSPRGGRTYQTVHTSNLHHRKDDQ